MDHREDYLYMLSSGQPIYISSGKSLFEPGARHIQRIFSSFVIMFIDSGTVYFTEEGKEFELNAGQWFIQIPGRRHWGHKSSSRPASFYWIHFMPSAEWRLINAAEKSSICSQNFKIIDNGAGVRIPEYELYLPLCCSYPPGEWNYYLNRIVSPSSWTFESFSSQSHFLELLNLMLHREEDFIAPASSSLADSVADYLKANYSSKNSLKYLSNHFHFSPDYIAQCVKRKFGMTPASLLSLIQLKKAKELLVNTSRSIQSIGEEIGYNDQAVFSRMFKKQEGVSPLSYRKRTWGISS